VMYEMLAGDPPYSGANPQAVLARRLTEPAPLLRATRDVPVDLEGTVARALARHPAERFATAGDFAQALHAAEAGLVSGAQAARTPDATTPVAGGSKDPRPRRWRTAAMAVLVVVAVGAALVFARSRLRDSAAASRPAAPASAAVLPFADLSPGHDQQYFSDGLTEELITALSRIDGLRVAARTSAFQFKDRQVDVRDIGRRLDVGAVLEGSVRRSGNRVRISAQLVSTRDGYQLWADEYDRELADVFAVQDDIARAITAALKVRLGGRPAPAVGPPTEDTEAHDLYLKGRFAWNQRTTAGMREAVRYLEQAVARDPGFARAQAALADAYLLVIPYAGAPQAETWAKAQAAAAKALALDSTLAEAHTALAYGTMIYDWDWSNAEARFHQAIAADTTYPTARQWYGNFLWSRGRLTEALDQMQRAHRLDPLSRVIGSELGQTYYLLRRNDEALRRIQETLALDPNYPKGLYLTGLVHIQQRRYAKAIDEIRRSIELGGFQEDIGGALGYAYGASGNRAAAENYIAQLEAGLAKGSVGPYALALAHTGLGETTRALMYLNRAIDVHDAFLPEDFFDPLLDGLRRDPRFKRVEARMGLP
jgi:eukaryotic-like serine/threonine-protein kinase